MDYNRIALFVRVAKASGFTAAARDLKLPKSSVSRSVSLLEKELGVRLFQRTTRAVTLTEAGQAFFESVQDAIGSIDRADALVREHGGEPRGTVRVSIPPGFEAFPETLLPFIRQYPAIQVEVSVASRFVDLVREGFDLAVRAGKLDDSTLVARKVGSAEMAVMASPEYLRRVGRPHSLEDAAGHDWVVYRAQAHHATVTLQGPEGIKTLTVHATLCADDLSFCRSAVLAGAGLGLLPLHTTYDALEKGRLERLLPGWSFSSSALFVVLPTARFVPARVALLRDFLVEQLGKIALVAALCESKRRGPGGTLRPARAAR